MLPYVNIHTHRPTGCGIELRTEGIHPREADRLAVEALEARFAAGAAGAAGVQAVGEIGLDFACTTDRALQTDVLRAQLALARRLALPVVLHCVRAFEPLMRELAVCEPRAVIFHGFIGSPEQGRQALRRGYCLSFGERTFASPKTLRTLCETPLERLFLETDDAEAAIEEIYARAAEAKGVTAEALQRATLENYERIFGKRNG